MATAADRVVVEAEEVVAAGTPHPERIHLPGALVDLRDLLAARGVTAWLLPADGRLHGTDGRVATAQPPIAAGSTVRGATTSGIASIAGERSVFAATVMLAAETTSPVLTNAAVREPGWPLMVVAEMSPK